MLERLHIRQLALIEEAEIQFGPGLNILTGETGAGKSMIIDAVNFVLGERAGKELVRHGATKASVEAVFFTQEETVRALLSEMDLLGDGEDVLILSRTMSSEGKSTCRINGTVVTASMVRSLSARLIDIHGQHAHQSLLNPARHIDLLDHFCGQPLLEEKDRLQKAIFSHKAILRSLEAVEGDPKRREERLRLLKEIIEEIDAAHVEAGEEEKLLAKRDYWANLEEIGQLAQKSLTLLYYGEGSALELLSRAKTSLTELAELDQSAESFLETAMETSDRLDNLCRDLSSYAEKIQPKAGELDRIEERLDALYVLKRKYGGTMEMVLQRRKEAEQEYQQIKEGAAKRRKLEEEKKLSLEEIGKICRKMTKLRTETAAALSAQVEQELHDLEMQHARFTIAVTAKKTFTAKGADAVEFLIAPNLGEEEKPLSKIASGGEMSRVMLALKTVMADGDTIDTFIFDEIDAGISGTTAARVAEKMAAIAKKRQVLCITHLPQIAAMADHHFFIQKTTNQEKTWTKVSLLEQTGEIQELARLIGGGEAGGAAEETAKNLKAWAKSYKTSQNEVRAPKDCL